jgi:hypothetical protein
MLRVASLSVGLLVSAPSHAVGQALLQEWQGLPGLTNEAGFGTCCDVLSDVDGDGVVDLLVGAPDESPVVKRRPDGAVYVMSGATGAVIRVHYGSARLQLGADVAALGDVDGDGVADYAAIDAKFGTTDVVIAWSGATGAKLWQVKADPAISEAFGGWLSLLPDLDHDGLADIGVATWRAGTNPGHFLTVRSAASGASVVDVPSSYPFSSIRSACRLDDVTGDGVDEFAIGHDDKKGKVEIVDGATLGVIDLLSGESLGETFGDHCGQVGDLDGDGIRDLVVSDQEYQVSEGRVYLFSGATRTELFHLDNPGHGYGYGVVAEQSDFDFDGDGVPDIAVGRVGPAPYWQFPPTGIDVWSGRSGRLLCAIPSTIAADEGLGCALQFLDWDGDGFDDVVGGAFWNAAPTMSSGMVHLFAGDDLFLQMDRPTWDRYQAGDAIEATTRGGEPNELMLLAMVDVDGSPTFAQLDVVTLDAFGEATIAGVVPPHLAGTTITLQAFATRRARHGLEASVEVVVGFK